MTKITMFKAIMVSWIRKDWSQSPNRGPNSIASSSVRRLSSTSGVISVPFWIMPADCWITCWLTSKTASTILKAVSYTHLGRPGRNVIRYSHPGNTLKKARNVKPFGAANRNSRPAFSPAFSSCVPGFSGGSLRPCRRRSSRLDAPRAETPVSYTHLMCIRDRGWTSLHLQHRHQCLHLPERKHKPMA